MKKKILLTAFTVISIMSASKTFAQYNDHGQHGNAYNNNGYHTVYERNKIDAIREIRRDQKKIDYDLQDIERVKRAIKNDIFHGFNGRYREHQSELQRLYNVLTRDRNEFAKDCRNAHIDERVASRF